MLKRHYMEDILDYAISAGADYAEVFFEDTERTNIDILNDRMTKYNCGRESGIGIRIFRARTSEYLYSADADEEAVFSMLKRWRKNENGNAESRKPLTEVQPHIICGENAGKIRPDACIKRLKEAVRAGRCSENCIVQGRAGYVNIDQRIQIANTEGVIAADRRNGTRVKLSMVAEGADRQSGFIGPGAMMGAEYFDRIDLEMYARGAAAEAKSLLGAKPGPVGRMPVVIANGFGELFFHEACGHSLEGSSVEGGGSEFSGKLGEKIASSKVTLVDDGSIPGAWGSLGIDDEGVLTRKNVLIQNGILKGYLVDRLSARRMGIMPTGSARRQNYRFAPVPRMTNTYIEPGTDRLEDMIRGIEKGLFVKSINAGSVDPVTGEFNFNTGATYLIEHGEITSPLSSATLVGTGGDILKKVDMVSGDFALGQGYCYADSGQLHIGAGQSAVRITEMTVGGKDV